MTDVVSFCRSLASRADTVEARQALFREELLPRNYSGTLHASCTVVFTVVPATVAFLLVDAFGLAEVVTVAAAILFGTTTVYLLHRVLMHKSRPPLHVIYDMHTRCHHMLFNEGQTEIRSIQDLYMVLFPPRWTIALALVGVPLLAAPLLLVSTDVALTFAGVAYLYFLGYELIHLAAHLPDRSLVHRIPLLRQLTRHHQRHHAWERMHHCNFSMIIPLWDWLLGTKE